MQMRPNILESPAPVYDIACYFSWEGERSLILHCLNMTELIFITVCLWNTKYCPPVVWKFSFLLRLHSCTNLYHLLSYKQCCPEVTWRLWSKPVQPSKKLLSRGKKLLLTPAPLPWRSCFYSLPQPCCHYQKRCPKRCLMLFSLSRRSQGAPFSHLSHHQMI